MYIIVVGTHHEEMDFFGFYFIIIICIVHVQNRIEYIFIGLYYYVETPPSEKTTRKPHNHRHVNPIKIHFVNK